MRCTGTEDLQWVESPSLRDLLFLRILHTQKVIAAIAATPSIGSIIPTSLLPEVFPPVVLQTNKKKTW